MYKDGFPWISLAIGRKPRQWFTMGLYGIQWRPSVFVDDHYITHIRNTTCPVTYSETFIHH